MKRKVAKGKPNGVIGVVIVEAPAAYKFVSPLACWVFSAIWAFCQACHEREDDGE